MKALLTLDVTNTLIELRQPIGTIYRQAFETVCGPELPSSDHFSTAFKQAFQATSLAHPCFGKHTLEGADGWWRQLIDHMRVDLGLGMHEEGLERVTRQLLTEFAPSSVHPHSHWQWKEGSVDLLLFLKTHPSIDSLGVVSNFTPDLPSLLDQLLSGHDPSSMKANELFACIGTSYGLGVEKVRRGHGRFLMYFLFCCVMTIA